MRQRQRIVAVRRVVEELQRPLVAAVAVVVEHPPVAAGEIDRLQDHEIGLEMHQAVGVARRLVEIDDIALRRRQRIDREKRAAGQAFIGAGVAEGLPVGEGRRSVMRNSIRLVICRVLPAPRRTASVGPGRRVWQFVHLSGGILPAVPGWNDAMPDLPVEPSGPSRYPARYGKPRRCTGADRANDDRGSCANRARDGSAAGRVPHSAGPAGTANGHARCQASGTRSRSTLAGSRSTRDGSGTEGGFPLVARRHAGWLHHCCWGPSAQCSA